VFSLQTLADLAEQDINIKPEIIKEIEGWCLSHVVLPKI
jgi:hypothetical protein